MTLEQALARIAELERELSRARMLHDATCFTRPELEKLRAEVDSAAETAYAYAMLTKG